MFRSRAEKKVAAAGYDPGRLPPGQYLTEKWPVLHAGTVPDTDLRTWTFRVHGEVENPVVLDWEQFSDLPMTENVQDIHCVTRWSRFDTEFRGVHWRELAAIVRPKPGARYVYKITLDGSGSDGSVTIWGQANQSVRMTLDEVCQMLME